MIIDIFYIVCLVLFLYRGYKKGVVVALFAVISVIAGIFCALKFSGFIAGVLFKNASMGSGWVIFLSYFLVFIITIFLIRIGAKALSKLLDVAFLGWINRLCGAILYGFMITLIISTFIWFINSIGVVALETKDKSYTYHFLIAFAPKLFSWI